MRPTVPATKPVLDTTPEGILAHAMTVPADRDTHVNRIRAGLSEHGFPRLRMMAFMSVAGGGAFGASMALVASGVTSMAVRYPIAVLVGYALVLLELKIWLALTVPGEKSSLDGGDLVPDLSFDGFGDVPARAAPTFGGGGGFSGGGGGSSWGSPEGVQQVAVVASDRSGGGGFDLDLGDEGALVLLLAIGAIGIFFACLTVVWSAPVLFAELLLDYALSARAYRRLKGVEPRFWLVDALKRTVLQAASLCLVVSLVGWGLQAVDPEVRTIGDVVHAVRSGTLARPPHHRTRPVH